MQTWKTQQRAFVAALATLTLALAGCSKDDGGQAKASGKGEGDKKAGGAAAAEASSGPADEIPDGMLGAFAALPTDMAGDAKLTDERVALGHMLYFDERLSANGNQSCNSCHQLGNFGVDNEPTSPGSAGKRGDRNSPSTFNAAGHIAQFWDGRAANVEEQAKGPILNPIEMGMKDAAAVEALLASIPGYVEAFKKAFPEDESPVTFDHFAAAVGAFERKLVTPSRWDQYLAGDKDALTVEEKKGFQHFVSTGCTACHNGAYVGASLYQKLGLIKPWPHQEDQGRFKVTKKDSDKMMFKVPSLRNVAKTGPYFHDGKTASLDEAVKLMARHQLGKELDDKTTAGIVAWLGALTGDPKKTLGKLVDKPELPALPEGSPSAPDAPGAAPAKGDEKTTGEAPATTQPS
jgi:cytochrome c peroxidase